MNLKSNIIKIFLIIIFCLIFLPNNVLAETTRSKIGDPCQATNTNDDCELEGANLDCEESNLKGKTICTCWSAADCTEAYETPIDGGQWYCVNNYPDLSFNIHYCVTDKMLAGDGRFAPGVDPLTITTNQPYCLGYRSTNNSFECTPVPIEKTCLDPINKFYLNKVSLTSYGNGNIMTLNDCNNEKTKIISNKFCILNGLCVSNQIKDCGTNVLYNTLTDCKNSIVPQKCTSQADCAGICIAGQCFNGETVIKTEESCSTNNDCKANNKTGACIIVKSADIEGNLLETSNCYYKDSDQIISLTQSIKCGTTICNKSKKTCTQTTDCQNFGGEGICKDGVCWLDEIAMKKYQAAVDASLFGVVSEMKIMEPTTSINIPGLIFSEVKNSIDSEGYLHIPYIGEYISAVYRLGMVVASILGVIMIIIVGAKIIVMGGEERVNGFKKIGQVIVGLVIMWGSYVILNTINPDLVNFEALKIKYIKGVEWEGGGDSGDDVKIQADEGAFYKPPIDMYCPNTGGSSEIEKVVTSLQDKLVYRWGGKHLPPHNKPPYAEKKQPQYGSFCPVGYLCLDCSGYVALVLKCVGLSAGVGSGNMLNGTQLINTTDSKIDWENATIDGVPLKPGDIIGWKSSDQLGRVGHVLIYSGTINGKKHQISESSGCDKCREPGINPKTKSFGLYKNYFPEKDGKRWFRVKKVSDVSAPAPKPSAPDSTSKKSAFSFAVISDTPEKTGATQGAALINAIPFINNKKPDFVVLLGDLTYQGSGPQFDTFNTSFLSKLTSPVVPIAGNHDFLYGHNDWYSFLLKQSNKLLPELKNKTKCGSTSPSRFATFKYKGQGFVLIDPYWDNHKYYLKQEELDCIESNVTAGDLVFRHVTPYGLSCPLPIDGKVCGSSVLGKSVKGNQGEVQNFEQLPNKLIAKKITALFSGHTHAYYHGTCNGLEYINSGTLGTEKMEYTIGWTPADVADSFVWVDVSETGKIKVTIYVYNKSTKQFAPQTKQFPATVTSKLIKSEHEGEMEGVNATCTSIQP